MVFAFVDVEAAEKMSVDGGFVGFAAAAGDVDAFAGGCEGDGPAGVAACGSLPVGFFGVHEEAFIEAADLFVDGAADEHAGRR